MKLKKIIALATLGLSSNVVLAEGAFDGVNAQIGVGFASVGNEMNISDSSGSSTFYEKLNSSKTGVLGTVSAGYSYGLVNKFNLAANLFYSFGSSNASGFTIGNAGDSASWNSKIQNLWGISVEPGYYFADKSLGFIKLGWAMASTKQQEGSNTAGLTSFNTGNSNGFLYGFGFKQLVTENVYIGIEAYQVSFSKTSPIIWDSNITISSKPNYTYGGINLGYKF